MLNTFAVNAQADWQSVAMFMIETARTKPVSQSGSTNYSERAREAMRRALDIANKLSKPTVENPSYAAIIVYRQTMVISVTMTLEPNEQFHLSAVELVMTKPEEVPSMRRLCNRIAFEMAQELLTVYEERADHGVYSVVRDFYQIKS